MLDSRNSHDGRERRQQLGPGKQKLHGRAFYESLGSPKYIMAPMVDQSEFAWRLLSRSFLPEDSRSSLLCYSPMLHSRLFASTGKYRDHHFSPTRTPLSQHAPPANKPNATYTPPDTTPHLDGHPTLDRPLLVQFCSNSPSDLLPAAQLVAPYCDAVDLNLGCPQGIARRGHYGAFLQEDWPLIHSLVNTLHQELSVPVTAKMRILETKERTLEYAKMLLKAGASWITVHGRLREQKGHKTGLADWSVLRYLREQLPPETVIFANGNVLQHNDIQACLDATCADGVMSAEGNLSDPTIFAEPPGIGEEGREYWRGRDGKGGWRMDAVFRRYLDIIHRYILEQEPPYREPLYLPSDLPASSPQLELDPNGATAKTSTSPLESLRPQEETLNPQKRTTSPSSEPPPKKPKNDKSRSASSLPHNLTTIQAHLFTLLRPLVSRHTKIRDALAKSRATVTEKEEYDISAFENVLYMVELAVARGLRDYEDGAVEFAEYDSAATSRERARSDEEAGKSSHAAVQRCKRPWFVCQAYVRPLPEEAMQKGAITLSRKEKEKLDAAAKQREHESVGVEKDKVMEKEGSREGRDVTVDSSEGEKVEVPREGVVCG